MDKVIHFLNRDKFTTGYINFMHQAFPQYEHIFFTKRIEKINHKMLLVTPACMDNLFFISDAHDILNNPEHLADLKKAKLIIISGLFSWQYLLFHMPKWFTDKALIQFWGGDIYGYRSYHPRVLYHRIKTAIFVHRCKGVIPLIADDYPYIEKMFWTKKPYWIADVPDDPLRYKPDYKSFWQKHKDGVITIQVGNSATPENCHIEVFDLLKKALPKDLNVHIISPLSYGDNDYREKVIHYAKQLFGDKFEPVTDYMSYQEYVDMLGRNDMAIFNNNRQQATINIRLCLAMGVSVLLRHGTSMWEDFTQNGFYFHDVHDLANLNLKELLSVPDIKKELNLGIVEAIDKKIYTDWQNIYDTAMK